MFSGWRFFGPYQVGYIDYEWVPPSQDTSMPAYCLARLYYPAAGPTPSEADAEYEKACGTWIPSSHYYPGYGYYLKIHSMLFTPAVRWFAGHLKLWAVEHARLQDLDKKLPVIVFSHGLAGIRTTYSSLCCDLASHGFVLASIEHRDGSASMTLEQDQVKPYEHPKPTLGESELHQFRARQLALRAGEASSTLDLLEAINGGDRVPKNVWMHSKEGDQVITSMSGRLDLNQASIIGHSFGAATAIYAATQDSRFKSCVAMDPWMYPLPANFTRRHPLPLLAISSSGFHWPSNLEALQKLVKHKQASDCTMITLKESGHMDQSDFSVAFPMYISRIFNGLGGSTQMTRTAEHVRAVLRSNNDIVLAFLKQTVGITLPSGAETIHLPLNSTSKEEKKQFEEAQGCIVDYIN